jgi:hypothetical protein
MQISHSGVRTAVLAILFCAGTFGASVPVTAANNAQASADAQVLINATPRVVWKAVHQERDHDPDIGYSRVISKDGDFQVLEQQFIGIPIFGKVVAVTKQREVPFSRIDYSLVNSDKFKALEGSWLLTPVDGGKHTMLQLSSALDVGLPFSGAFVKNATKKKVVQRVENVKRAAEAEQANLAAAGKLDL